MACLRLVTAPPFPPLPDLSVPLFSRCTALFTDLPAALPYFLPELGRFLVAIVPLFIDEKQRKENELRPKNGGKDTPMERPAQPEEVAPAFVFFASEVDSSYISPAKC